MVNPCAIFKTRWGAPASRREEGKPELRKGAEGRIVRVEDGEAVFSQGVPPVRLGVQPCHPGVPLWCPGVPPIRVGVPPGRTGAPPRGAGTPPCTARIRRDLREPRGDMPGFRRTVRDSRRATAEVNHDGREAQNQLFACFCLISGVSHAPAGVERGFPGLRRQSRGAGRRGRGWLNIFCSTAEQEMLSSTCLTPEMTYVRAVKNIGNGPYSNGVPEGEITGSPPQDTVIDQDPALPRASFHLHSRGGR